MAEFPYLRRGCVQVSPGAADKDSVLAQIARLAAAEIDAYDEDEILEALKAREAQSSTGLENGIAIPHCRLDRVTEFIVGVLLLETGVEFDAIDGSPSRAFVFIIGPTAQRDLHIRILSAISRGLVQTEARSQLLSAHSAEEIIRVFVANISLPEAEEPKAQSQMTIYVQSESAYETVLEIFSNPIYGSAMAVEAANAGRNLRSLPLFSAFWTDRPEDFAKLVIAVVPKAMTNDIIRKLNMSTEEGEPGVMITVQDLSFVSGSLRL